MTARWVFLGYLNAVLQVRGERYMNCTLRISFEMFLWPVSLSGVP